MGERPVLARVVLALAVVLCVLPWSTGQARSDKEWGYSFGQTWSAAVRMLQVGLGLPVKTRDRETGFVLFEYKDHDRAFPASMEIVDLPDPAGVRVVFDVKGMPSYVERMLHDRLGRKLLSEYGEVPRRPVPPPGRTPEAPPAPETPDRSPVSPEGKAAGPRGR